MLSLKAQLERAKQCPYCKVDSATGSFGLYCSEVRDDRYICIYGREHLFPENFPIGDTCKGCPKINPVKNIFEKD